MLSCGHEPGARVVRDARLRPLFERGDESILSEVLGETDIAHDSRQAGDEPRRLDPPDCVDGAMSAGSHCYRSHHASIHERKPDAPCCTFAEFLRELCEPWRVLRLRAV